MQQRSDVDFPCTSFFIQMMVSGMSNFCPEIEMNVKKYRKTAVALRHF